ncbi:hypothetical protein HTZ77_37425 [Nonomuraea sp. SMC257]|uniref:Uncharacterized protein n=1 Tax=Nonomuraea montanisoli TaxID=2741721 RepID=A0A7Y6IHP8_9ACTN|nr:hypothetical protein [Nonomuraea montanisoli]NUW37044.1 hypothetical protein [Nonomuraea montanisoli]
MTIQGGEPSTSTANDVSHAADLRAAARWLVGASASVVAVLVAGVQLRDFAELDAVGVWAVPVALLAVLIALATVVWTLYGAAAVLAVPRRSIGELADLDRADNGDFPGPRLGPPKSALISHLVRERRTELLGVSRDAIWQLNMERVAAYKASAFPRTGKNLQIGDREYDPDNRDDSAALANLIVDLDRRVQAVVDAAASFETQRRYDRLRRGMRLAGLPFVVSFLALVWLQTLPPALMKVKSPTSVQVVTPGNGGDPCSGKVFDGVAVGGTMDAPLVVLPSQGGCPARKLTETDKFVVIPRAEK